MKHNLFLLLILIFFSLLTENAFCQKSSERAFSDSIHHDLQNKRIYKDFLNLQPEPVNFWQKLFSVAKHWLMGLMKNKAFELFFKLALVLSILAALFFIVMHFLNVEVNQLFKRNNKRVNGNGFYSENNIHELDLEEELNKAIAEQNHKQIIRFYFLIILKLLHQHELIQWEIHKSNYEYLLELQNSTVLKEFKPASHYFDVVWYGNYAIAKEAYEDLSEEMKQLHKKVKEKLRS